MSISLLFELRHQGVAPSAIRPKPTPAATVVGGMIALFLAIGCALQAQSGTEPPASVSQSEWKLLTDREIWGSEDDVISGSYPNSPPPAVAPIVPRRWTYLPVSERLRATEVLARWILDPDSPAPIGVTNADQAKRLNSRWRDAPSETLGSVLCAYAEFESASAEVRMARLTGSRWMMLNGELLSGDVERRGFRGVPVALKAGKNRVFIAADDNRFEFELWKPSTSLVIEPFDIQWPPLEHACADHDLDFWFPVFNATASTETEVHVHYGSAVRWNQTCKPKVTDWTDSGYIVPLGMQLVGTFSFFGFKECEAGITGADHDIYVPVLVFGATGFADRKLLRRQGPLESARPNNFDNITRTPISHDEHMTRLWSASAVHVLGTKAPDGTNRAELARSRYLQCTTWYQSGCVPTILVDDLFESGIVRNDSSNWISRHANSKCVVLYGNENTNKAWSRFVDKDGPIQVHNGGVRIHGVEEKGDDLAGWYTFTHEGKQVTLLFDTGEKGARLGSLLAVGWSGEPESAALFRVSATAACGWERIPLPAPK